MAYLGRFIFILFLADLLTMALFISKAGILAAFFLWLLSAMAGGTLMRQGGLSAFLGMAASGGAPIQVFLDGMSLVIAGLLFISPGFLSDAFAVAILIPPVRRWISSKLTPQTAPHYRPSADTDIIEGDFVVVEEDISKIEHESQGPA
jgi:UPF0716 protein FxsA